MTHRTDATPREGEKRRADLRLITHDGLGSLDRWTLAPADVPEAERLTTWITVNPAAVVDLDDRR